MDREVLTQAPGHAVGSDWAPGVPRATPVSGGYSMNRLVMSLLLG
jgi:hypothetical protein